jgi:acyl-coenzyme A synthetase/AMP-(fatty) acid ligase
MVAFTRVKNNWGQLFYIQAHPSDRVNDYDLFFVDPVANTRIGYEQLERDVDALHGLPDVCVFSDCTALFTTLLRAIDEHKPVVLVENEEQGRQIGRLDAITLPPANFTSLNALGDTDGTKAHTHDAPHDTNIEPRWEQNYRWNRHALAASGCRIGLLTSGTTGQPKLIMHTLEALTRNVQVAPHHRSDRWGLAYHPTRFAGLQVFLQALANRNPLIRLYGLSPSEMHAAIDQQQITHLSATPTLLRLLASDGTPHPHVARVTLGGEVADQQLLQALKTTFPNAKIRNIYASTEVGALLSSDGESFQVPEALQSLIQIIDGELAVHRQLLASSLQDGAQDDFYRTGDCVELLHEHPLTFRIIARRSDIINVGGFKVNPLEVEALLTDMPEVAEVAVYGRTNSVTGSLVCCDVVLSAGKQLTTQQIIARLKPIVAAYKIPRIVHFVEQLSLTSTGKRQRGL